MGIYYVVACSSCRTYEDGGITGGTKDGNFRPDQFGKVMMFLKKHRNCDSISLVNPEDVIWYHTNEFTKKVRKGYAEQKYEDWEEEIGWTNKEIIDYLTEREKHK